MLYYYYYYYFWHRYDSTIIGSNAIVKSNSAVTRCASNLQMRAADCEPKA